MLAIIDYGAGNLTSVKRALDHLKISSKITADPVSIAGAKGIIFPGVGHAAQAMQRLAQTGLDQVLAAAVNNRQPLLGICLGCHILLEKSEEGPVNALGLLNGSCLRFCPNMREADGTGIHIPHMGWNRLRRRQDSPLLEGIDEAAEFYFVHSYYPKPAEDLVIATTTYGTEFCSFYGRPNLWAVQFHPEKSGRAGLRFLQNFNAWCQRSV